MGRRRSTRGDRRVITFERKDRDKKKGYSKLDKIAAYRIIIIVKLPYLAYKRTDNLPISTPPLDLL